MDKAINTFSAVPGTGIAGDAQISRPCAAKNLPTG